MSPRPTNPFQLPLVSFSVTPDGHGDRQPVVGIFPSHIGPAEALAALVEGAALDEGIDFGEMLKRVAKARPPEIGKRLAMKPRAEEPAGRPAREWEVDYGKSAPRLGLEAITRSSLNGSTWTAALKGVLQAAADLRIPLGRRRPTRATIKKDTEALRQALRAPAGLGVGWARNPSADVNFDRHLWESFDAE